MCISPSDCSSIQTIFTEMTVTFFVMSFRRRPDIRVSLTSLQCRALFVTWNWNQDNKMYFFVTLLVTKDPEGRAKRESGDTASNGFEVSAPRTAHWRLEKWVEALYSRATMVPSTLPWSWGFSRVPDLPSGHSKHISITKRKITLQITASSHKHEMQGRVYS